MDGEGAALLRGLDDGQSGTRPQTGSFQLGLWSRGWQDWADQGATQTESGLMEVLGWWPVSESSCFMDFQKWWWGGKYPEYSLEGLMLKLKLQYFGHLMRRTDSLEKTLILGKIEGRRRGDDRG